MTDQTAAERPRFICENGHNIVGGSPDTPCTVPLTPSGAVWTNPWPPPDNVLRCGAEMEWELVEPGAVAAEREACADLAEHRYDAARGKDDGVDYLWQASQSIAAEIRNRGETPSDRL